MDDVTKAKDRELTGNNTGGLNVDDLLTRPDLAMRYIHPPEGVSPGDSDDDADAATPVPFFPPVTPNNGPKDVSAPPIPYQSQQIAGQNQVIQPLRAAADFDPFQMVPAPATLVGNQAPDQLPAQVRVDGTNNGSEEAMLGFDLGDQGTRQPRPPPSPFPIAGPLRDGENDRPLFGPFVQNERDAAFQDLRPGNNLAVATIPSGAIDIPPVNTLYSCMAQCELSAEGECADWSHVDTQQIYALCGGHKNESSNEALRRWQPEEVMSMRAYACNDCVLNLETRNPLRDTGARVFGRAPVDGKDDVAVIQAGPGGGRIGGLQGRNLLKWNPADPFETLRQHKS